MKPAVSPARRAGLHAFSLVELLVVLAIIAALMVIAVPPVGNLIKATEVTQAADQLQAALAQARQTAIARNRTVEFRIYRYRHPNQSSEPSAGRFRATQSFVMEPGISGTTAVPTSRIRTLPKSVYLADAPTLSTILDASAVTQTPGSDLAHPVPPVGANYTAARIRFFPDGSTDLDVTAKAYLTIVPANTQDGITTPPDNFATLLVQPLSGKTRLFRP